MPHEPNPEIASRYRLRQDISKLIFGVDIIDHNFSILYMITNEMITDVNMFCSALISIVFHDCDGTLIVPEYFELLRNLYLQLT